MNYLIAADSSSNLPAGSGVAIVPLKIITDQREFLDDAGLNLDEMLSYLQSYKGRSGTSCPNVADWLEAFGDSEGVFTLAITSNLSGAHNAAVQAAEAYMEEHPDRRVCCLDSLSTGPEMMMMVDKIKEGIDAGDDFETIKATVLDYNNHNHTLFCLRSMNNLARNGRVHPAVAKIAGVLNIRAVGDVEGGEITPIHKPRGDKKATETMVQMMKERGFYDGAILRIAHCFGEVHANALVEAVKAEFPNAKVTIEPTTALCSFYAEVGGLIIGYQGKYNTDNLNFEH